MKVEHINCGPAANESELKAIGRLKTGLISETGVGDWYLLTNLTFSTSPRHQSDEIDIVSIGPTGVRVIEVKHWRTSWVKQHEVLVEREADRLTMKARRIGTTLRKHIEQVGRVDGIFLITEEEKQSGKLQGRDVRGVRFHVLKDWKNALNLTAPSILVSDQVAQLKNTLYPKARIRDGSKLRRLGDYVNLELQTPNKEGFCRIYKGTHRTHRRKALVYLYDLSASDGTDLENQARRAFESMQQLSVYRWAPRIYDSFQSLPGYDGEMCYFTIDDPSAPTLRERASDDEWEDNARLEYAHNVIQALSELHGAGESSESMLHRNITPDTLLVRPDNSPYFTGFEYTRLPNYATVAGSEIPENLDDPSISPEIRTQGLSAADTRSDIYSLCSSLSSLFRNRPGEPCQEAQLALDDGTYEDPSNRCDLFDLQRNLPISSSEVPQKVRLPSQHWSEDHVVTFRNRDYRIVARLGRGGIGTTYKVVEIDSDSGGDLGFFVGKTVSNEATGNLVLQAYRNARSHVRHTSLSTIFETADEWQPDEFVALMAWIDGEPLSDLTGVVPLYVEESPENHYVEVVRGWLLAICDALEILHQNRMIHGDVSPRNLIVSNGKIVLTDYDCVTRFENQRGFTGTVEYSPYTHLDDKTARSSDDFFSLAASFFHVLFDRDPFLYNGRRKKDHGLNWDGIDRSEFESLTRFFDTATDPNPDLRIKNTFEARKLLKQPDSIHSNLGSDQTDQLTKARKTPDEHGTEIENNSSRTVPGPVRDRVSPTKEMNEVKWVGSLLKSYPGSRMGNSEARGLDSDFAHQTYVETNLEKSLYEEIISRKTKLVVLCGNAGDGKTALLQHLANRFGYGECESSIRIHKFQIDDGLSIKMNLDGSASWNERSADQLLDEFLAPLQNGTPSENIAHLLAINDGRLLEWIETHEELSGATKLTEELKRHLDEEGHESPDDSFVRFINLNQRSLVGNVAGDQSEIETEFLESLLNSLYGGGNARSIWSPCETCTAEHRCEIRRATKMFGPKDVPGTVSETVRTRAKQRLFELLQAVHLRGETHITVRELRAVLVHVLFGVHSCREIHQSNDTPLPYWDRAFSSDSPDRQGDVLHELIRFDPALDAHPMLDRRLLRDDLPEFENAPSDDGLSLASARRQAYFEWTEDALQAVADGESHVLDLAQARYYRRFRDLPTSDDLETICRELCGGISRLEGLPPQALNRPDVVPLRITPRTPTETVFWVEKDFSAFKLEPVLSARQNALDRLHRQALLVYTYKNGRKETLRLGADLFNLLLELSEGFQLGDVSSDDTFAQLAIFVQRLVREDDRRLCAWNPMDDDTVYQIRADVVKTDDGTTRQEITVEQLIESTGNGR